MRGGLRIGIDVGGTNTDAVLVDAAGEVLAWTKMPTTEEPADGIERALAAVLPTDRSAVVSVALGTTHALNAVLRRRDLGQVAVLRLAAPATRSVPPFAAWPEDLRKAIDGGASIVAGGVEVDGRTHPLDHDEIRRSLDGPAVDGVAITGPFSLQDASQELEAAALVREVLGQEVTLSLGHEVGGLGLLERENAAILNSALARVARKVVDGFRRALHAHGLDAVPYLTQNDGTMMSIERGSVMPVLTIGAGAANSIRGAAALTGLTETLVVDVGGTSTDVGAVTSGFPRESAAGVDLGGVRTNFRMPDVVSIALGGGTIVDDAGVLGIDSVGNRLAVEALVFGGPTVTLSDAAVAAGRARMGNPMRVRGRAWPDALAEAEARVADALDRVKLAGGDVPVVLVGGGSVILPDVIPGASHVHRPERFDVANAIGAAIGLVSGEADLLSDVGAGRDGAIEACLENARRRAVAAGADPAGLQTVWIDEIPLAYLDRPVSRFRAKVAGPPQA